MWFIGGRCGDCGGARHSEQIGYTQAQVNAALTTIIVIDPDNCAPAVRNCKMRSG